MRDVSARIDDFRGFSASSKEEGTCVRRKTRASEPHGQHLSGNAQENKCAGEQAGTGYNR